MEKQGNDIRALIRKSVSKIIEKGIREQSVLALGFGSFVTIEKINGSEISKEQQDQLQRAFMSGAEHLWAAMYVEASDEGEVASNDMVRMHSIYVELEKFAQKMSDYYNLTDGGKN